MLVAMTESRDVQSSLADMDRKLRELQRELAMVSRGPEGPAFSPPAFSAPPPPPPPQADGREFDGQVVIDAGPFPDIATLGSFEQALARLPQAEDVYVREFTGSRALIDVLLAAPVALLDEMRRAAPVGFGLVEV